MEAESPDVKLAVVSLRAPDVRAAALFYRDVLGLRLGGHHGPGPHFDLDGIHLLILPGQPDPAPAPDELRFPRLAFAVPDLEAAVARLRAHGVDLPWGVESSADGRWVMFYDPAGNLIELVSFQPGS
ncbi:MAG: VOC family protein [Anaerolineales bacterium]|jgi:catechol 2,3-dioxygenase-like lactoylglutathione lyase family enzyme